MVQRALDRMLEFDDKEDKNTFVNQLVNPSTLSQWIKCAFNGNVLELNQKADTTFKARVKQTMYIDNFCSNRTEVMKRIHKINYSKIFSNNFNVEQIDN